jgi:hypothetical protein
MSTTTNTLLSSIDFAKLAQVSYKQVIDACDDLIANEMCSEIQYDGLERLLTYKDSLMMGSMLAVAPEQMMQIIAYWQIKTTIKTSQPMQHITLTPLDQSFLRLSKVVQKIHRLHVEQNFMPSCYRYVMPLSCLQGSIEIKIQLRSKSQPINKVNQITEKLK